MAGYIDGNPTRQRILEHAAVLFAEKGFTETSTRELAEAAGLNSASLYYHFPSKNAILECMLEDYSKFNTDIIEDRDIRGILSNDPTSDGILACLQTSFPPDRVEYYLKVLHVLLHEQLRNPIMSSYMANQFILRSERSIKAVIDMLKNLGIIRKDADPDFWMKTASSLFYSFATRRMLGIGDDSSDFKGMRMVEMLKFTFDMMLEKCAAVNAPDTAS